VNIISTIKDFLRCALLLRCAAGCPIEGTVLCWGSTFKWATSHRFMTACKCVAAHRLQNTATEYCTAQLHYPNNWKYCLLWHTFSLTDMYGKVVLLLKSGCQHLRSMSVRPLCPQEAEQIHCQPRSCDELRNGRRCRGYHPVSVGHETRGRPYWTANWRFFGVKYF
jgi:hypothetical protein